MTSHQEHEKPEVNAHDELHPTMTGQTEPDMEAPEARGLDLEDIPSRYWWSFRFLGSATSIILLAVCLYVGFSLPVSPPSPRFLTTN